MRHIRFDFARVEIFEIFARLCSDLVEMHSRTQVTIT